MTGSTLTDLNLAMVGSSALSLPKPKSQRRFDRLLDMTFEAHRACLAGTDGELAAILTARRDRIDTLTTSLLGTWRSAEAGKAADAADHLAAGLAAIGPWLDSMSRRLASILAGRSWYRLSSWEGATSHEHMFHVPFGIEAGQYRFSAPKARSLYLANSVYLCWLECGRPPFDDCKVSRFELDTSEYQLLNFPANSASYAQPLEMSNPGVIHIDPRQLTNSPYRHDVNEELAEYLTVWPLLAAATFEKRTGHAGRQPEYLIPQLLAEWVSRSERYVGIRYFTSKSDQSMNSNDWSINVVLPCPERKRSGYSEFLSAQTQWTEPQPLAAMRQIDARDLATPEAVDLREARGGRVMLRQGHNIQHYITTTWGKMEYWLDRPEFALSSI